VPAKTGMKRDAGEDPGIAAILSHPCLYAPSYRAITFRKSILPGIFERFNIRDAVRTVMEYADVKKWVIFFVGILVAIVIANALSNILMAYTGVTGWMEFVISFVLYAGLFFAILYLMERFLGIEFFGFGRQ
jgi:hypothetical protein